ncbi:MAG: TRAP transporter substrate-binding protein [Proteobacteria bacterium]|jgi:TRAP-type mannitol/chloroaromatic compound transport system substrate-binding protein|nr:TRAP transporter substrate-binding protein [Alphaproteobacteria bacterium]MDA0308119.1 TRAP transporter substrate-binding protein [Pseudomonadota bacterium]MDA0908269.1 TRAP transporter substrate-binding protein [Pseudomonadota bacterium]
MNRRDLIIGGAVGVAAGVAGTTLLNQSNKKSELAAPSVNKERIEVAMVSTWPKDFPGLGTGAQRFAQSVTDTTDGRIQVTYYAAGERVGAFDSFDEVASGNAQMYHGADYYWKGKHPGWAYFTAVPFGLTYTEIDAWMKWMGGQELHDELAGSFGLKCIPCGNTGVQWGGWFNKEINSADDIKGLKMRIPGLGGDVMAKLGASPVSLPGGQIYENLVSGAIDATEWVGPWNDEAMKFYEAAKYYYYPGMHEPGSQLSIGMNASFWSGLSESDQMMIKHLAYSENANMMAEYNAKNGAALVRLQQEQGVEVKAFNDEVYAAFGRGANEVFAEVVEHSDLARRIHESFLNARTTVGDYLMLNDVDYINKRNKVLGA